MRALRSVAEQSGKLVRKQREAAGLTTRELAERAGLSSGSRVTKIEFGVAVTLDNLYAIASALKIPLKELVP